MQYVRSNMHSEEIPDTTRADEIVREMRQAVCGWGARRVDKPLYLFGIGNLGAMAFDYFHTVGIEPCGALDFSIPPGQSNRQWKKLTLRHPAEWGVSVKREAMLAVCVSTHSYEKLAKDLSALGWQDIVPFYDIAEFYRNRHPLSNGWFAKPMDDDAESNIKSVLRHWSDSTSSAHYLQFLCWRYLRRECTFADAPIATDNRYFIPEILDYLGQDPSEIQFLDVGAHHGEVTEEFARKFKGQFGRIDVIEADLENLKVLEKCLQASIGKGNFHVYPSVVGGKMGSTQFRSGLGYASQIVDGGGEVRKVITIDSLELNSTFIKLHLEGWELPALRGAEMTLKRCRPAMAITVYHNESGIFEIAKWLFAKLTNYQFLFRLHGWCGTAAVIYAIPRKKLHREKALV